MRHASGLRRKDAKSLDSLCLEPATFLVTFHDGIPRTMRRRRKTFSRNQMWWSSPATKQLVDAKSIGYLKKMELIVNIARGKLIEQDALVKALERKEIGGM